MIYYDRGNKKMNRPFCVILTMRMSRNFREGR